MRIPAPKTVVEEYLFTGDGVEKTEDFFVGTVIRPFEENVFFTVTADGIKFQVNVLPNFDYPRGDEDELTPEEEDYIDENFSHSDTALTWGWKGSIEDEATLVKWMDIVEYPVDGKVFMLAISED